MQTRDILKLTVFLLEKEQPHVAARYDLKGAIMRLGPAGFEFEALVAEILKRYGYMTERNLMVQGACVEHEIDIVAQKRNSDKSRLDWHMIESKYHNTPGIFTGLKVALYTWARFADLLEGARMGKCRKFSEAWLVSNTKFSERAITYATCKNLRLIGWSYPHDGSLKKLIEDKNLYPITVLRTLDRESQEKFARVGLMLAEDLVEKSPAELQRQTGISTRKIKTMADEARAVLRKEL